MTTFKRAFGTLVAVGLGVLAAIGAFVVVIGLAVAVTVMARPKEASAITQPQTSNQSVVQTSTPVVVAPTDGPPKPVSSQSNDWVITWLPGANLDRGDGSTFRQDAEKWTWRRVAPELWPVPPNVPNPKVPEFPVVACADDPSKQCVPDGVEIVNAESNFCQQLAGEACRVPVAARHYHFFSGDYDVPNIGSCQGEESGKGCLLVITNVGDVTSDFTGIFGQGFRLHGRYWNGNALDMAMWALVSHGANTMMNMDSKLNPQGINNAGANCSVPGGCQSVDIRVVFVSGNEPLLKLETEVSR